MDIDKQVNNLMDQNQALMAWDLVKDTDYSKKDRVWLKVKHAFNKEDYLKYYGQDLTEYPTKGEFIFSCNMASPRFAWLIDKLIERNIKSVLDIGCSDGYLGFTVSKYGISSVGLNLYKPSVERATKIAEFNHLPAKFICQDFFDYDKKHQAVVFFEILEHLPNPQEGIIKAYSLIEDGGYLYISTPRTDHIGIEDRLKEQHDSWDDGLPSGHLKLYTEEELRNMLKDYNITQFGVDAERSMIVEVKK